MQPTLPDLPFSIPFFFFSFLQGDYLISGSLTKGLRDVVVFIEVLATPRKVISLI